MTAPRRRGGWASSLASRFLELSPESLIAGCRLAIALFGFVGIWPEQSTSAVEVPIAHAALSAFLVYAVTLALVQRFVVPDFGMQLVIHSLDIVMLAALMHLTDGPSGGYFVFFAMALLFATLRWSWVGVVATTLVLVVLFVGIAATFQQEGSFRGLVTRGAYLVVAGIILTYLGALRAHARSRLAKLACWPAEPVADSVHPPLEQTLSHALSVTAGRGALVLWEEDEEPFLNVARLDASGFRFVRRPPVPAGVVAREIADAAFQLLDPQTGLVHTASGNRIRCADPLNRNLVPELADGTALVAPLRGPHVAGHVLLVGTSGSSDGMLPVAEMIASHISTQIEHHMLHTKLAASAVAKERMQMGRDLHDGTVQAMTAVALRLQSLAAKAPEALRPSLGELRQLVTEQQRELREYLALPRDRLPWDFPLLPQIGYALREIEELWGCAGTHEVTPSDTRVSLAMGDQLNFLIKEAAANAVRHGGASRIDVAVKVGGKSLSLVICDNGSGRGGASDGSGELLVEAPAPRSLALRVQEIGGTMSARATAEGLELVVDLPL